jgi:hypothetical protein
MTVSLLWMLLALLSFISHVHVDMSSSVASAEYWVLEEGIITDVNCSVNPLVMIEPAEY